MLEKIENSLGLEDFWLEILKIVIGFIVFLEI